MDRRAPRFLIVIAAAVVSILAASAGAQSIGRLFTTPEQRRELDQLRIDAELAPEPEPVATVPRAPTAPIVDQLTINGLVVRSSGRNSTWLNGSPVPEGGVTRDGIKVDPAAQGGERLRITLPSGIDTVELKPGQKIDVVSGRVLEAYEYKAADSAASAFAADSLEKLMQDEESAAQGGPPGDGPTVDPGAAPAAAPLPAAAAPPGGSG